MKVYSVFVCIVLVVLSACDYAPTSSSASPEIPRDLQHSMKGYELYSWQVGEQWHFTLFPGTNRLKPYNEIVPSADNGWTIDTIKAVLRELPPGEEVLWIGANWRKQAQGEAGSLMLPPQKMIDEIRSYCEQLGVKLQVTN